MLDHRSRKFDVLALALLALGLFLTVSLVTYRPADVDSGTATAGTTTAVAKIANACGRSGAYAAEGLFRLLGWGAYFFVASLLAFDIWLLIRRPVNDFPLRAAGWVMALVGVTAMLALVGPPISPGPLIGPGGYLGAAGRAVLEINFATAGAFILTASLIVAGTSLCTDYHIIRFTALAAHLPIRVGLAAAGQMTSGALLRRTQTDLDEVSFSDGAEPAVVIRGKR